MGRTPHVADRAGEQARHAALVRSARIGPVRRATAVERRRARRPPASSVPPGASPPFRADVVRRPNAEPKSETGLEAADEVVPRDRDRSPRRTSGTTDVRTVEERSSRRPFPAGPSLRLVAVAAVRAIARVEVRAIGSAVWLERCFSRRGPLRIPAPALMGHDLRPREPAPVGSCQLRPGAVAAAAPTRYDTWPAQPPAATVGEASGR